MMTTSETVRYPTDGVGGRESAFHASGQCPGLDCPDAWHIHGCDPMWQYVDAQGCDITGHPYAEQEAVERRRWDGPDGPDLIEYRVDGEWGEA